MVNNDSDSPSKKLKRIHDTLTKNRSQCFDLDCSDESTKSTSTNQCRTITATETVKHPSYSLTSNRRVYTPVEFLTQYNSLEWGKMIILEEWCKKGYVPVKKRQVQYILAKFKTNGKIKPQWELVGRERLLLHSDTFDNYCNMMTQTSTCVSKEQIKHVLKKAKLKKAKDAGIVLVGSKAKVSRMTTQRYHKELAIGNVLSGNASIIQKP